MKYYNVLEIISGNADQFKKLQEALEVIEKGGKDGKFNFEFDEGDGTSFWSEMKKSMADSEASNADLKPIQKDIPETQAGPELFGWILCIIAIFIFYFWHFNWRRKYFPA